MTEAETAVRRFYESLSTGNATLVDEVLTPEAKTSRCPAISAHAHNLTICICGQAPAAQLDTANIRRSERFGGAQAPSNRLTLRDDQVHVHELALDGCPPQSAWTGPV